MIRISVCLATLVAAVVLLLHGVPKQSSAQIESASAYELMVRAEHLPVMQVAEPF